MVVATSRDAAIAWPADGSQHHVLPRIGENGRPVSLLQASSRAYRDGPGSSRSVLAILALRTEALGVAPGAGIGGDACRNLSSGFWCRAWGSAAMAKGRSDSCRAIGTRKT